MCCELSESAAVDGRASQWSSSAYALPHCGCVNTEKHPRVLEFYTEYTARIEIINGLGLLERVHFRVPAVCKLLTEETKEQKMLVVDRVTPGRNLDELPQGHLLGLSVIQRTPQA